MRLSDDQLQKWLQYLTWCDPDSYIRVNTWTIRTIVKELLERRAQEAQTKAILPDVEEAMEQRRKAEEDRCLCGGRGCNSCEPRGFYGYL